MDKKTVCPNKEIKCEMPKGKLFSYVCCGSCKYGDYDRGRDQVYCGKYRHWYDKSDSCKEGEEA